MDCSPPGSSVRGILQARILEWVAIPFSKGSSQPRDWTQVSCIAGRLKTLYQLSYREVPLKQIFLHLLSLPTVLLSGILLTACLPRSSVHEILQTRILEWVVVSLSRKMPWPGIRSVSPALAGGFFTAEPPGKPHSNEWNTFSILLKRYSEEGWEGGTREGTYVFLWLIHFLCGRNQGNIVKWISSNLKEIFW